MEREERGGRAPHWLLAASSSLCSYGAVWSCVQFVQCGEVRTYGDSEVHLSDAGCVSTANRGASDGMAAGAECGMAAEQRPGQIEVRVSV